LLVLEDDRPQIIASVNREPAYLLLVFDMCSQMTAANTHATTRDMATRIIESLGAEDTVAAVAMIQNGGRPELIQNWSNDRPTLLRAIKYKFLPAARSRLNDCLILAADVLKDKPAGNTHVIIFTDGLEIQTRKEIRSLPLTSNALRHLAERQATLHIFSYASITEQLVKGSGKRKLSYNQGRLSLGLDMEMRRWVKNYTQALNENDNRLNALAEATGGRLLRPESPDEALDLSSTVMRDITAHYIVTYKPRRAFALSKPNERRHIKIIPRRAGLDLFSLRTSITTPAF